MSKIRNIEIKIGIIVSLSIALFFSTVPFFGWSEYSLEGLNVSCSVEWNKKTPSVISYNITIAILIYFVPLFILIFTNSRIIYIVSRRLELIFEFLANIYNLFSFKKDKTVKTPF